jgi:hypothetical protein
MPANLSIYFQERVLPLLIFSPNNQVATDNAEGAVILHPSYLGWFESLGGPVFA